MSGFELTAVGTSLAKIAELLEKLKGKSKDREITQICSEFNEVYFTTKEKALALYADNLRLNRESAELKQGHAEVIARMAQSHAQEIAALKKPKAGIKCDCCGEMAAEYICTRPSTMLDYGACGLKERHYKCSYCKGEFDQQISC